MRGKITVAVILIGSALFYWYAFWFFNSLSPADVRFNMNREAVPASVTASDLLPLVNFDHTRQSAPVDTGHGWEATYTVADGTPLRFNVTKFPDADSAKKSLEDYNKECTPTAHTDARVPYIFLECKTTG